MLKTDFCEHRHFVPAFKIKADHFENVMKLSKYTAKFKIGTVATPFIVINILSIIITRFYAATM